jgi:hypothetical protein
MAPPPRLLRFHAVLLFLSVVLLLLAVSGVHATRHHTRVVWMPPRAGIGGEMHHAVARWWSRTIVRRFGGGHGGGHGGHGGHGRGHGTGDGHGTGGTSFYPRTVTGHGHHRSSAAAATGRPSARVLLLVAAAAVVVLLLRLR